MIEKNNMQASIFSNGAVRFDFGAGVKPDLKKKAMDWAKKRGLNVIEESLGKSENEPSFIVYGNNGAGTEIVAQYKVNISK